jgi:hypothetical protein
LIINNLFISRTKSGTFPALALVFYVKTKPLGIPTIHYIYQKIKAALLSQARRPAANLKNVMNK